MTTMIMKEETFKSRWLNKKGVVRVEARRNDPQGFSVTVTFDDGEQYDETLWDLPWQISKMLYNKATVAADALIFKYRCVVADKEVWLISGSLSSILRISCKTGQHFCEGKQFLISEKRSDREIRELISKAVEEEVPF